MGLKRCTAWLAAAWLLFLSVAATAQSRAQFGSWLAVCQSDSTGYCSANAKLADGRVGTQGYAFQLHVWRASAGDALQVTFLAGAARPGEGEPMRLRVDGRELIILDAGSGYRSVRSGNAYVLTAAEPVAALLSQMLTGKRLQIAYRDAQGGPVAAAFSLDGFKQALARFEGAAIDRMMAAKRAVPEPTARREPEPAPGKPQAPAASAGATPTTPPAPEPTDQREPEVAPRQAPPALPEATPTAPPAPTATGQSPQPSPPSAAQAPEREATVASQRRAEAPSKGTPDTAAPPPPQAKKRVPSTITELAPAQKKPDVGGPPSRKGRRESLRQFACRGNEPAWSLAIDHQQSTLGLPDADPASRELTGKFSISGEGRTPIMTWRGKAAGERSELIAVIVEQVCRDSMSAGEGQTTFAFQTQVTLPDGRKVRGCCNAGLPAAATPPVLPELESARAADFASKSPEDWARLLPELQPAIDVCVSRTPGPSPYVTKAWPMNQGLVGVRTRGGDGGWFGCIVEADGKSVNRFEMLPRGEPPLPGENLTLFTPVGRTPRAGTCWEHERVLDAAGKLLGYLSYNKC